MKSTYIFRGKEEEIEISFNMEHETEEDEELAWGFLYDKILNTLESEDEIKERFYLDNILDIEINEEKEARADLESKYQEEVKIEE